MKNTNIVVVGAGQLGSRHLQALAKLEEAANITVVDPFQESLVVSENRVQEVPGWEKHSYSFVKELEQIPSVVDFVVIATAADVRKSIVMNLLEHAQVRYILLEKVLFQTAQDCVDVGGQLKQCGTQAWINAPRRMWSCYKDLKKFLDDEKVQGFYRSGNGWGLACNSYHMLDLFAWLSNSRLKNLSVENVCDAPIPSKREGFYELKGTVFGSFENGISLTISDHKGAAKDAYFLIETQSRLLHFSEKSGQISLIAGESLPAWVQTLVLQPEFQSNLTHEVAKQLLEQGSCDLASYEEASDIHQIMLAEFAKCFSVEQQEEGLCPIT